MTRIYTRSEIGLPCAVCLSRVGFGLKITSRILRVSTWKVAEWRKRVGLPAQSRPLSNPPDPNCDVRRFEREQASAFHREQIDVGKYDETRWWGDSLPAKRWIARRRWRTMPKEKQIARSRDGYIACKAAGRIAHKAWERIHRSIPENRIRANLRTRLYSAMKADGATKSRRSIVSFVGCDSRALKAHLERQFKRGMTWDNYGSDWHIDHIIPCAAFDHTNDAQVKQCWNWQNLRPLWAEDNLRKSNAIVDGHTCLPLGLAA